MFSLVARQAMTDMAFVGPMTLALALGALALFDDDDQELPRRGRGLAGAGRTTRSSTRRWPCCADGACPQLVVDSIQLKVRDSVGRPRPDDVRRVAMIPYSRGSSLFVLLAARTRYKAPLYLYLAAILCGLAVLAKGLAGLGLPVIVFLAYLAFTWNWRRLRRAQLR